jgi:hypothetical protein
MKDLKKRLKKLDEQRIVTAQTILWFGKHKNLRVEQVINEDPGWLVWAIDQNIFLCDDETYTAIQRAFEDLNDNLKTYRED